MEDSRWAAVAARDAGADGRFVYAVETTGIYCRPSCGARRPRQEHVTFHATPVAAERAGFRACLRCRPNEASAADRRVALVTELCRFIDESEEAPTLERLAARAGSSPSHTQRLFKAVTGLTPSAYAAAGRAQRMRTGLLEKRTVTEAIHEAGYGSTGRFYAQASEHLGMTPSEYRAGGDGVAIAFAVGECSLGSVLVAATERGVCAILLGDDPSALVRDLEDRFVRARLEPGGAPFERQVALVIGLIEHPRSDPALPLDVRGTVFQQRVWTALTKIPAGQTVTYAELAERVGLPGGARAVAGACAANPLAVAIPCHRVVRSDGSLSGYRWGVERKRALLEREADE